VLVIHSFLVKKLYMVKIVQV